MRSWLLSLTLLGCNQQPLAVADFAVHDAAPFEQPTRVDAGGTSYRPCDPVKQTGCAPGEKCTQDDNLFLACLPDGDKPTGAACGENGVDDCVSGDYCPYDSVCRQLCHVNTDCTQAPVGSPTNFPVCDSLVCSLPCDPITNQGCPPDWSCEYGLDRQGREVASCASGPRAPQDWPCLNSYECNLGYGCMELNGERGCYLICDQVCPNGQTCHKMPTNHWGFCF